MKAEYCVDYLSHQWNTDDLIITYRETRKQRQKYVVNNVTATTSLLIKNEKKLKKSEEYKSKRFQNALWRGMARKCTNNLGKSNKLINPATVSWQKESDITWLYGPLYTNTDSNSNHSINKKKNRIHHGTTQSSLQGLKPVLKKQSNVTQLLPSCSDPSLLLYYSLDSTTLSEFGGSSTTTSGLCSSRSSFSSVSSSTSSKMVGVHFNPEIIEIEYQPEYPVSLESSPLSCPSSFDNHQFNSCGMYQDDDEDDDEDDALWSLLVQASETLKSSTYTQISFLFSKCLFFYNTQQKALNNNTNNKRHHYHHHHSGTVSNSNNKSSTQLFILLVSMMKSVVSLTTTWLLYQSISPLSSWLSKPSTTTTAAAAAAGQSTTTTKQSKKARLIIL